MAGDPHAGSEQPADGISGRVNQVTTAAASSTPPPDVGDLIEEITQEEKSQQGTSHTSGQKKWPQNDDDDDDDDGDKGMNELNAVEKAATGHSLATITTGPTRQPELPPRKPWYRQPNPLRWGKMPPIPDHRAASRENSASWLSRLTLNWITPLMKIGYRRPLELNDMWLINPDRAVAPLTDRYQKSFRRRVERGDKYPLFWALHECFFREFWASGLLALAASIFQVMSPFTLRYLIQFASDAWTASETGQPAPHIGVGVGLVLGVTGLAVCQSLATHHGVHFAMVVGGQARGVLISAIFEKTMVLSGRARAGGAKMLEAATVEVADPGGKKKKANQANQANKGTELKLDGVAGDGSGWDNGRIVNLMSIDTFRIDQACSFFHLSWAVPTACLITLAMLLINLTYSALAGFALLCIGVPVLGRAVGSLFARRNAINKITDQRVSMTQELLGAVRFVKYFAWESAFLERLQKIRDAEIYSIQVLQSIRSAILAISFSLPVFAAMLSFITFSLSKHDMHPAQIFSSLAIFNNLRVPLNMLPNVLSQIVDAWSSLIRIQEFLLAEEQEDEAVINMEGKNALELHDASFTWERNTTREAESPKSKSKDDHDGKKAGKKLDAKTRPASAGDGSANDDETAAVPDEQLGEPFRLEDLNINFGRNELVAVIGPVGCGKSSLLAALAGDMRRTCGQAVLGASRAFCPQYAWIQNTTVLENILFGKPMDRKRYHDVVKACALQADLDMLPSGDMTEIGERGITISGGQKQRLNIARASYVSSDIVLMDDPLSAVDAHVGRQIFDKAILGLLGGKCRILATHQLWVLDRCDRIVCMDAGRIKAVGTFDDLMRDDASFRKLLEITAVEKKKPDEQEGAKHERNGTKEEDPEKRKRQKAAALMQQEERAVSSVSWSVYASYLRASGSLFNTPVVLLLLVLTQGANIASSFWLSAWTSNRWGLSTGVYIGGYVALGVGQTIIFFGYSAGLSILATRASKRLLRAAAWRVLRAPMSFFDTTPLGRITNRFSRDVDVMDNIIGEAIRMFCSTISMIIAVLILIIVFYYYFAAALVPMLVIFLFSASYYRASAREVKRFESILRSTVFARFSEGLAGVASIRAYGLRDLYVDKIRESIDDMNSVYFLTFTNQRWLSLRLDLVGNVLVLVTGILVITSSFSVSPSIAGLVLSYIVNVVQMMQMSVRNLADVENSMISAERLQYYGTRLEEEAPLHTTDVPPSWPDKGDIIFQDVEMRYRPGLPLVLRGLTMHVRGGERIGIVGRTGAGKSSILAALFRLSELAGGSITLDGLDIAQVGLHDLRYRLAVIPQDPTLFKGTIRSNLDLFGEHTDLDLWSALRRADLVQDEDGNGNGNGNGNDDSNSNSNAAVALSPLPAGAQAQGPISQNSRKITLDTQVEEDGLNFSLGQRQLMALARALVRDARVIICDEATSSVDVETDDRIQHTIATNFAGRTLLCIAHRLRTIVGYDRVCIMDAGTIAELDTPATLWRQGGIFRSLCERGRIRAEDIPGVVEQTTGARMG